MEKRNILKESSCLSDNSSIQLIEKINYRPKKYEGTIFKVRGQFKDKFLMATDDEISYFQFGDAEVIKSVFYVNDTDLELSVFVQDDLIEDMYLLEDNEDIELELKSVFATKSVKLVKSTYENELIAYNALAVSTKTKI